MERQQVTKDEESIQWHNAYCAATELELADNADVLNFHRELVFKTSNIELARDVKEEGIMTIMEMAAPMIEEERKKAIEERKKAIEERKKVIEERKQGVRNMAEAYWELNGNAVMAAQKIRSKYPDVEKEFIDSVIREVYGMENFTMGK